LVKSSDLRYQRIHTQVGVIAVCPLNLRTIHMRSDDILINRVHYEMYGPLFWIDDEWKTYEHGRSRDADPNFTLLRHDDVRRQGSHAAYRKAASIIEPVVNEWMPSRVKFARLAIDSITCLLGQEVVKLAEYYSHPPTAEKFHRLVTVREDYLATLGRELETAMQIVQRQG
jgi:hypothetical protein